MPQISLYIDEDTLKKIALAAKTEKTSLSKWVVSKLREAIAHSWPENYGALFGSITDKAFTASGKMDFSADTLRKNL